MKQPNKTKNKLGYYLPKGRDSTSAVPSPWKVGFKIHKEFVYLVSCEGFSYYKIGFSRDVVKRIGTLDCCCPFNLILVFWVQVKDGLFAENSLKKMYAHRKLKGEWFDLTIEEVRNIVGILKQDCIDYMKGFTSEYILQN